MTDYTLDTPTENIEPQSDTFHNPTERNRNNRQTDKKEISNGDFLTAIFFTTPDSANVTVISLKGDPAGHKAWKSGLFQYTPLPEDCNNYFCISSHYPQEDGTYKRQKKDFAALHVLVLDDISIKILFERISLEPTWALETSPGNFQYGYLLEAPIADVAQADRLLNTFIAAGLTDKGASGAASRLMRLPVGINGKAKYASEQGKPFTCQLHIWEPQKRFTVDALVEGFELDLIPAGRPKKTKPAGAMNDTGAVSDDDVYLPRPVQNPVIEALINRGLYKRPIGDGRHDITCPWVSEHTGGDDGAAYFEPNGDYPLGGFKCLHSHGATYRMGALLNFLGIQKQQAKMKPTIRVTAGELNAIVTRSEKELAGDGRYYQAGGIIVHVSTDPAMQESAVQALSAPALTRALSAVAEWERYDGRTEAWVRSDPPVRHCGVLFNAQKYDHLNVLMGLTRQPYMYAPGCFSSNTGYDPMSKRFGIYDGAAFHIPDKPSMAVALAALALLKGLLAEFSFAADHDRAAALCLLLTASIRSSLPHAPMFHIKAPVQGSGKSYACKVATAFATPAAASPLHFPESDEECGKLLLAVFLKSPAVVEFDDLNGDIQPFSALKTAITEEAITGRILGLSKDATVSTRTLLLSSGNNVDPVRDMTRRVLTIQLDPQCSAPAQRLYTRPDLLEEVKKRRGELVSAAMTIIRAWVLAGSPLADIPPVASFGQWSKFCRHSLVWLGLPDPCTRMFEAMADDPDAELLARLMTAWEAAFGSRVCMTRDLIEQAEYDPKGELAQCVSEIAEERGGFINRKRLGRWVKRHELRIVSDMRIKPEKNGRNASAWSVEKIPNVGLSVISVSSHEKEKSVKTAEKTIEVEL